MGDLASSQALARLANNCRPFRAQMGLGFIFQGSNGTWLHSRRWHAWLTTVALPGLPKRMQARACTGLPPELTVLAKHFQNVLPVAPL